MSTLTTVKTEIPRDRWGRPLVVPPEGGDAVSYTRCTRYVGCLEDTYNITQWEKRMVAKGLTLRADLLLAASSTDDKRELGRICDEAKEAARGSAAATTGTALHRLTEMVDHGLELPPVPDSARASIEAYQQATAELDHLHIEQFTVLDELQIGGTPDRVSTFRGRNVIADVKTGNIKYGQAKIAMQLAVYAHSQIYDAATNTRTSLPDVDLERALVIHLPADEATCTLHWVDIDLGWQAVQLATRVRALRNYEKRKPGFLEPVA